MGKIHIIDLHFLEARHTIASFLVETVEGPILIETGPESTFQQLELGIRNLGYQTRDIQHVFLTHIHFDHAGAAWKFAGHGAKIHVHPIGKPHLAAPDNLWNSASRIYGEDMHRLWGSMEAIPEEQLLAVEDGRSFDFGKLNIKAMHTPGHATHHIAWQIADSIFCGDVAGVKINNGPVVPPCPPPDIHLETWKASIGLLRDSRPNKLFLTHFGIVEEIAAHLTQLETMLDDWAAWMKPYFEGSWDQKEIIPKFMDYTRRQMISKGLRAEDIGLYESANPSWMSVAGLMRYWKLKSQGRIS